MRRRLLILAITLTAAVLTALIAPLVTAYAEERAVTLHEQRLAAATRFAALVDDSTSGAPALLEPDLARYDAVVGSTRSAVIGTDGSTLASGREIGAGPAVTPGYDDAVERALAGTPTAAPSALWPWRTDPMIVATPIGRDGQILGAVVMIVDTAGPRDDVATGLAVAAAGGVALLALVAFLVGVPLVSWVVRPVDQLTERVQALAGGHRPGAADGGGPPELRRLATSFDEMARAVEYSRSQQRDLIADVSHQLANPLTAMRLRLDGLAADDPAVEPVLAEADRMARALEGVIEVSRAGGHDRRRVAVDVAAQIRERIALWEPLFDGKLQVNGVATEAPAVLEEDLVPTIVDTLLDNAVKYAPDSVVEVTLSRTGGDEASRYVLTVRDHGGPAGADPTDSALGDTALTDTEAAELGERFHRLPRHANVDGTGLGLSILVLRVRDAGGSVVLEAAHPGLRCVTTLPARPGPGTSAAIPDGAAPGR
ncbi:sensor histidine kinase [Rhodococcoides corynebacterioides]|uniref:histidine kinase n=1 Tax=Rhodococcoides corynebacterioides TaxID=53972 RepID=A0ABS7NZC3_9NOCA|nr:HAMP domain-containing sensor histidine kinase [Rhodococcus corynebacterioides]MBY6365485.1 HAMP domain-containing histidine kinase [Rhodococcus corynebacterioides]MBY6409458.1 HAMP domain-containing histidine kinase [Rhodococcus corynebacterioides]